MKTKETTHFNAFVCVTENIYILILEKINKFLPYFIDL